MKRILGAVITAAVFMSFAPSASAQSSVATLTLGRSAAAAGESVAASGSCTSGLPGINVDGADDYTLSPAQQRTDDGRINGSIDVPREAQAGSWRVILTCSEGDAVYGQDSQLLAVTAVKPVPATVSVKAGATSRAATFSGTGCVADGSPLRSVTLRIGPAFPGDNKGYLAETSTTAAANGTWQKTIALRDYVGDGEVVADCSSENNRIHRRAIAAFSVGPAGSVVPRNKIARTGAVDPPWLPYVGLLLLGLGAAFRRLSPKSLPSGS